MKTIQIHGQSYTPISERVKYFNEHYPKGSIITEILNNAEVVSRTCGEPVEAAEVKNSIIIKATVMPDISCPERLFTGMAREELGASTINKTSHVEVCETSAIGRALGFMGVGIIDSVASADEVVNAKAKQASKVVSRVESKPKEVVSMDNHMRSEIEKDLDKMLLELAGGDKASVSKIIQVYTSFTGKDGKVKSCDNLKDMSDAWISGLEKKVRKDYDEYKKTTTQELPF